MSGWLLIEPKLQRTPFQYSYVLYCVPLILSSRAEANHVTQAGMGNHHCIPDSKVSSWYYNFWHESLFSEFFGY